MKTYQIVNMRLTREKQYYEGHMRVFSDHMTESSDIRKVQFGKQDIRGGFSITLIDSCHCVPSQKLFNNKDEMLGYLVAYNEAQHWHGFDEFGKYHNTVYSV